MTTENEIFTSQVRDANNVTLDVILANLTAQTAIANGAQNTVMVSANGGSTLAPRQHQLRQYGKHSGCSH